MIGEAMSYNGDISPYIKRLHTGSTVIYGFDLMTGDVKADKSGDCDRPNSVGERPAKPQEKSETVKKNSSPSVKLGGALWT